MDAPTPVLQRSAAELLAWCAVELFPGARLAGGGCTEHGFYYDIVAEQPIDDNALPLLEEKMRGKAKEGREVQVLDMMRENASSFMKHHHQPLRADQILRIQSNIIQMIKIGPFTDLCEAPYVASTSALEYVKLLRVEVHSITLPNGDIHPVKRIIGVVAAEKPSLKQLVKALNGGAKHDHRKYCRDKGVFHFIPQLTGLAPLLGDSGVLLRDFIIAWWKKEVRGQGFSLIASPLMIEHSVFEKYSFDNVDDFFIEGEVAFESLSLPDSPAIAHALLYNSRSLSTKDLPFRTAEFSPLVPTKENPGLHGAMAARLSGRDFAFLFCTSEQLEEELISSLQFIVKFTKIFGFEYRWTFVGQGKAAGVKSGLWTKASKAFQSAFASCGLDYSSVESTGFAVGPKITAILIDRYGREWKGPEIAIDLALVERLGLSYNGAEAEKRTPYLIAQSLFGPIDRFAAMLLEHYGGTLPFRLAPEQVRVIPGAAAYNGYADETVLAIERAGYRASADCGNDALGKKIGAAEKECVPCVVSVGENEVNEGLITVRFAGGEGRRETMTLKVLLERLHEAELERAPETGR